MFRTVARFAALALLSLSASTAFAQVKDEVDRFTGKRSIVYTSTERLQLGKPYFMAGIVDAGSSSAPVSQLIFLVGSVSNYRAGNSWKYLQCNSMAWLVDGKPVDLGRTNHDGDVTRGGVTESLTLNVSIDQLRQLGNASSVEYRICHDEYRLSPADIAGVRDIVARAAAEPGSAPIEPAPANGVIQPNAPAADQTKATQESCVACAKIGGN